MIKRLYLLTVILAAAAALSVAQTKAPQQQAPKGKGISKKEAEAINAIMSAKTPDEKMTAAENLVSNFADTEYKAWAFQAAAEAAESKNPPDFAKAIFYGEKALEAD